MKNSIYTLVFILSAYYCFSADFKILWDYQPPKPFQNIIVSADNKYLYEYNYSIAIDLKNSSFSTQTIVELPINPKMDAQGNVYKIMDSNKIFTYNFHTGNQINKDFSFIDLYEKTISDYSINYVAVSYNLFGEIAVYNLNTKQEILKYNIFNDRPADAAAFSENEKYVLMFHSDSIYMYNLQTNTLIFTRAYESLSTIKHVNFYGDSAAVLCDVNNNCVAVNTINGDEIKIDSTSNVLYEYNFSEYTIFRHNLITNIYDTLQLIEFKEDTFKLRYRASDFSNEEKECYLSKFNNKYYFAKYSDNYIIDSLDTNILLYNSEYYLIFNNNNIFKINSETKDTIESYLSLPSNILGYNELYYFKGIFSFNVFSLKGNNLLINLNAINIYGPEIRFSVYNPHYITNQISDTIFCRFLPDTNVVFKFQLQDYNFAHPSGVNNDLYYLKNDNLNILYKHDLIANQIDTLAYDFNISSLRFSMDKKYMALTSNTEKKTYFYDLNKIKNQEPILVLADVYEPDIYHKLHISSNFKYLITNVTADKYAHRTCYELHLESLSVNNNVPTTSLSIFPNPATDYIEIFNVLMGSEIEIFNSMGILIDRFKYDSRIDISKYPIGIYTVRSNTGTQRFIKI